MLNLESYQGPSADIWAMGVILAGKQPKPKPKPKARKHKLSRAWDPTFQILSLINLTLT